MDNNNIVKSYICFGLICIDILLLLIFIDTSLLNTIINCGNMEVPCLTPGVHDLCFYFYSRLMNEAGRNNMSPISLTEGVSVLQGILCEMLISLQLCLVIAGSTDAKRRKVFMASMPIGFAVVVGILAGVRTIMPNP